MQTHLNLQISTYCPVKTYFRYFFKNCNFTLKFNYWIWRIWKSGFWRGVNSDVKKSHANYVKAYFQSSLTQICIDPKKSNFAQICRTKYIWLCTSNVSKFKRNFTELIALKLRPILNRLFLKEILHYGKYTLSYFVSRRWRS